jgi:AcrR family transcriptional regulator
MRARQDTVDQTRTRITEATMRLHEDVGPAATTVSAIAELAGVTRLTVYRHFPDDDALIEACSAHWRALHPAPDLAGWAAVSDPEERLRTALAQTYAWARTAAPMLSKVYRDIDTMPAFVGERITREREARVAVLTKGFGCRGRAATRLSAAIAHALHVGTWESLCDRGGLRDDEAVELMTAAVLAAVPARAE